MDAVIVLKTIASMCRSYERCSDGCPLYGICTCSARYEANPELIVAAVEEWRKDRPAKTRQSEFLSLYPNALLLDGVIDVCPAVIDTTKNKSACPENSCGPCMRKFWTEEIE